MPTAIQCGRLVRWVRHTGEVTDSLIEEFADWLDERGVPDASSVVDDARGFLDWRADAPLTTLDENAIRQFLLEWCPRHLNLPPDQSPDICKAVGELVSFLGWTRRLRGGPERGRKLAGTATGLAETMRAKMADQSNFGMAKSLFAGIEGAEAMTEQELMAAIQRRVDEHNALPLEQRRAATDRFFEPRPSTVELPFVHVPPPEAEVAAVAAAAVLPAKMQALRDYLGDKGKALTAKGHLKLADGRALVEILDTGDVVDPKIGDRTFRTHSTAVLPGLTFLLALAEEAGVVRHHDKRLVPIKVWSRKSSIAKAASLFRAVIEYGVLSTMRRPLGLFDELHTLLDEGVMHWLAGLLAPGAHAEFDDIVDLNRRVVLDEFAGAGLDSYVSGQGLVQDVSDILNAVVMTGAIEWTGRAESATRFGRGFWTGGTISITALGRHVLPHYLPAVGITLRTAGDLTDANPEELVAAMGTVEPDQHSSMLAGWKPSLPAAERAGLVAAMAADAVDAHTRLVGLRLLGMFDTDVAEPHMRQLLDTPAAGHAAVWLLDHGLADGDTVGGFITPTMMVDILAMLIDHPDVLCEQFLGSHDPDRMLEAFWRHPAPETAAVLDVLGHHLPDRALAKRARKAAIKHRSWMANIDRG